MIFDKGKDVVENEVFMDLTKGVEQGDGTIGKGICLVFTKFRDGNYFGTLPGREKLTEFEDGIKDSVMK